MLKSEIVMKMLMQRLRKEEWYLEVGQKIGQSRLGQE